MKSKYFEGDGVAFGSPGHYYKWIVPFWKHPDRFHFEEVSRDEYMAGVIAELGAKIGRDTVRFPIPRLFDPTEQLEALNERRKRLEAIAHRYLRLKQLKNNIND